MPLIGLLRGCHHSFSQRLFVSTETVLVRTETVLVNHEIVLVSPEAVLVSAHAAGREQSAPSLVFIIKSPLQSRNKKHYFQSLEVLLLLGSDKCYFCLELEIYLRGLARSLWAITHCVPRTWNSRPGIGLMAIAPVKPFTLP